MALTREPTVVVLRALGVGDLLTAVPAIRGVRRALPDHRVALATDPALTPLVNLIGGVDELVPARGLASLPAALPWDRPAPRTAVNLHGRGPQSHRLLQRLSPGRLVAYARVDAGVDGPEWRADEHEVARWARLVGSELSVRVEVGDLLLHAPDRASVAPGAVVVHPGAASQACRWPADRFAQVARRLDRLGHAVVVTGSAQEASLAAEVAAGAGLPATAVLAGSTTLDELAGLVADAALVISGDTGVAHLATAFAVPSVVLFGPVPPSRWGPISDGPHICLWRGSGAVAGDPHGTAVDPALARIQPTEVADTAVSLLAAANHSIVR